MGNPWRSDPENRIKDVQKEISALRERERHLNEALAGALMDGGELEVMRTERRRVRDDLEDFLHVLSRLEIEARQIRQAEATIRSMG